MDYEKAYKEALERARKCLDEKRDTCFVRPDVIFPELKESEDERIRKYLISLVKNWDKDGIISKYTSNPNDVKQILAWLEKQGEQKPTWSKEDDELITAAICFIDNYNQDNGFACNGIYKDDVLKWIKSFKQRIR